MHGYLICDLKRGLDSQVENSLVTKLRKRERITLWWLGVADQIRGTFVFPSSF